MKVSVLNGVVLLAPECVEDHAAMQQIASEGILSMRLMDDEQLAPCGTGLRGPLVIQTGGGRTDVEAQAHTGTSSNATYHQAKAASELYRAKLSQLEYEQRIGKMVRTDDTRTAPGQAVGLMYRRTDGVEIPCDGGEQWLVTLRPEGGTHLRRYIDGMQDESYRDMPDGEAAANIVAAIFGFEPPRALRHRDRQAR